MTKPETLPTQSSSKDASLVESQFALDLENPACLGYPKWSVEAGDDNAVYNELLGHAQEAALEDEWKEAMIRTSVYMTTKLSPDGLNTNIVSRAQKKALSELDTWVSL